MQNINDRFYELRKNRIRQYFSFLNNMQQEAVLATEGPLLVLAGAGSGKTTVLINRILNLIKFGSASDLNKADFEITEDALSQLENSSDPSSPLLTFKPVEPWRILAITFTNKAADELKNRLAITLGEKGADVWALTFHSACVKILRHDAERIGFQTNFSIYDTSDSIALIKTILKDLDYDDKQFVPKSLLNEFSKSKTEYISAEEYCDFAEKTGDLRKIKYGRIFKEYSRRLFSANAMDFDDLLYFTVKLFDKFEDCRLYWQKRFRYVLIDEYQDTNTLQFMFADYISGYYKNICVVGDDDQSIYRFRGATIENILSFEDKFSNARVIRLEQNYRSTGHILSAANSVIKNNISRKGKTLWTSNSDGFPLEHYSAYDEQDEARYIADRILSSVRNGDNYRDNAVLYRMNAQSGTIEYALKRNGIPYRIIGGTRFFDRSEVKDIISYLNVILTPSDDLRLTRIINVPARGIGSRTIENLKQLAYENNSSMFEIAQHSENYPDLHRSAAKLKEFTDLISSLKAFSEVNTIDVLFDELISKTGYLDALTQKDTPEDNARAENVREIKSGILNFIKENPTLGLEEYLSEIALFTDLDNYDAQADSVVLMTVHGSKGLEFTNVYLAGMEETVFPTNNVYTNLEELEEERRLCYVAITRAKKRLYIISARQRTLFGRTTANRVSRFVEEIDADDIKSNVPDKYRYSNTYVFDDQPNFIKNYNISDRAEKTPAVSPKYSYSTGDNIIHKVFGSGVITDMKAMGGDWLITIRFVNSGDKKLMLKAASAYMKPAGEQ